MRFVAAPVGALLLSVLAVLPAAPALATEPQADITVVTRTGSGGLAFRTDHAPRSQAHGMALRWRARTGVVAADVEHRVHVVGDPLRDQQWGLAALRASDVQAAGDATGQVIAVVDSGVDASHPDLAGVVLPGTDLVSGGDGRTDPNGHGTHVAGIAAAVNDNGIGGAGLALGARVLPVRVIGADGSGTDGDAAHGVVWAVDHGATVVNLSLGGPDPSSVMSSALRYALSHGVSVVVAAGNEALSGDAVQYPAAEPGVIAVAAVDRSGVRAAWSSTGPYVALSAPGVGILSTVPGGGYASWSGTSMATPFVAASVALLQHAQPQLTPAQVRARLTQTAHDLGPTGYDTGYGYGLVDLAAAEGLAPSSGSASASSAPTSAPDPAPTAASDPAAAPSAQPASGPAPAAPSSGAAAPTAPPVPAGQPAPAGQPTSSADPSPAELPGLTAQPAASAGAAGPALPAMPVAQPVEQQPTPAQPDLTSPSTGIPSTGVPAVQGPPPVTVVRISVGRSAVAYRGLVTVSTRTMSTSAVAGGVPVRLERYVGGRWVTIRTGRTEANGLLGWQLHPDRTSDYRVVSATGPAVRSAVARIVVRAPLRR